MHGKITLDTAINLQPSHIVVGTFIYLCACSGGMVDAQFGFCCRILCSHPTKMPTLGCPITIKVRLAVLLVSGSSAGIRMAMHLTRALGTVLLKSTVSTSGDSCCPNQVSWAELANDIVVNEKTLLGSR